MVGTMKEISYFVFDAKMAAFERKSKRLCTIIVVLIVLLVLTNGAWIVHAL